MSHRHATGKNSHRRYSWAAHHAATDPIGSHCGSGRTAYSGLPACRPSEDALLVGAVWRVGSSVPRWVVYLYPAGNAVASTSGTIPPFHHLYEGALPWYHLSFSTS